MKKLYINLNQTETNSYELEKLMFEKMVNDYFCFDTYQELAEFIRQYCFRESQYFESNIPFDQRYEEFESDPEDDDAYNKFYESLTEKDFKEICEDYKDDFQIKYIEFDVDDEIKYFSKDTKELLDEYTKEEQRLIVLNFLDYPSNQIESEVVEKFEIDDVEFAGISCKLNFRYHH
nr:MAG TPA: hypothetical protein [Caudoviricetes sp.]